MLLLAYVMSAEEKEQGLRDEERFKFDLFTRNPELYDQVYGEAARAREEEEATFVVPESEEDIAELLEALKHL
jgi:hypothetical protein